MLSAWCLVPLVRGPFNLERETGIEPATNSLEGCDSTTELLPPSRSRACSTALHRHGGQARLIARNNFSHCAAAAAREPSPSTRSTFRASALEGWWGGEGSNLRSPLGGRFTV